MEHRYSSRSDIGIKSLVFKAGIPVSHGIIRDASHGGLFVEIEPETFRRNQLVDVEFRVNSNGRVVKAHVKAIVARVTTGGIGLELADDDDTGYEALCALVGWCEVRERYHAASVVGF